MLSLENGEFETVIQLSFQPNRLREQPDKTDWLSWHLGCRVFSSTELDQCLQQAGMAGRVEMGESILVGLKRRETGVVSSRWSLRKPSNVFYHAFPVSTVPGVNPLPPTPSPSVCPPPLSIEALRQDPAFQQIVAREVSRVLAARARRVAVFFDGQNFLYACRELGLLPAAITALLKKILSAYDVKLAKFFICWEADPRGYGLQISQAERAAIEVVSSLEIVERPGKAIRQNGSLDPNDIKRFKTDVDLWLATAMTDLYRDWPGLEGIVLVSGDSDFAPALEIWLQADKGGAKYVEVVALPQMLAYELKVLPGVTIKDPREFFE